MKGVGGAAYFALCCGNSDGTRGAAASQGRQFLYAAVGSKVEGSGLYRPHLMLFRFRWVSHHVGCRQSAPSCGKCVSVLQFRMSSSDG